MYSKILPEGSAMSGENSCKDKFSWAPPVGGSSFLSSERFTEIWLWVWPISNVFRSSLLMAASSLSLICCWQASLTLSLSFVNCCWSAGSDFDQLLYAAHSFCSSISDHLFLAWQISLWDSLQALLTLSSRFCVTASSWLCFRSNCSKYWFLPLHLVFSFSGSLCWVFSSLMCASALAEDCWGVQSTQQPGYLTFGQCLVFRGLSQGLGYEIWHYRFEFQRVSTQDSSCIAKYQVFSHVHQCNYQVLKSIIVAWHFWCLINKGWSCRWFG